MVSKATRRWDIDELSADMLPPSDDDTPTALDGERLDTPQKLIEHLERINTERQDSGFRW